MNKPESDLNLFQDITQPLGDDAARDDQTRIGGEDGFVDLYKTILNFY